MFFRNNFKRYKQGPSSLYFFNLKILLFKGYIVILNFYILVYIVLSLDTYKVIFKYIQIIFFSILIISFLLFYKIFLQNIQCILLIGLLLVLE